MDDVELLAHQLTQQIENNKSVLSRWLDGYQENNDAYLAQKSTAGSGSQRAAVHSDSAIRPGRPARLGLGMEYTVQQKIHSDEGSSNHHHEVNSNKVLKKLEKKLKYSKQGQRANALSSPFGALRDSAAVQDRKPEFIGHGKKRKKLRQSGGDGHQKRDVDESDGEESRLRQVKDAKAAVKRNASTDILSMYLNKRKR